MIGNYIEPLWRCCVNNCEIKFDFTFQLSSRETSNPEYKLVPADIASDGEIAVVLSKNTVKLLYLNW